MLAAPQVAAGPQPRPVVERIVVLAAAPQHEADARAGQLRRIALEGEAVDVDGPLVRAGADVAVRRDRRAHVHIPPAPARIWSRNPRTLPATGIRHAARKHPLEVATGKAVLALQEERTRKLQADTHQLGPVHQHRAERRDRLVQKRIPPRLPDAGLLRRPDRREAEKEEVVGLHLTAPNQRTEHGQRLLVAARVNQRTRLRPARCGSRTGRGLRCRLIGNTGGGRPGAVLVCAERRRRKQDKRPRRKRAKNTIKTLHRRPLVSKLFNPRAGKRS